MLINYPRTKKRTRMNKGAKTKKRARMKKRARVGMRARLRNQSSVLSPFGLASSLRPPPPQLPTTRLRAS